MITSPLVFMSYAQFDDDFEGGALSRFCDGLSRTLQFISGGAIAIFQDRTDIAIGQPIQERISESLNEAMVLVLIVTPSFFNDPTCQDILTRFLERERQLSRNDLVLAVYYQRVPDLDNAQTSNSPLLRDIAQRRMLDWQPLRGKDFNDPLVRQELERLANRIIAVLNELQAVKPNSPIPMLQSPFPQPTPTVEQSEVARSKYLERLEAQILREFHQDQYVMLHVESLEADDSSTLTAIQQALHSSFDIHVAEGMLISGKTSPLADAIANQRLVTLLGGPGVGKTTSLRFVVLQQIQAIRNNPDNLLPVWVNLGKWSNQELSAEAFLWQEFNTLLDDEPVSQEAFAAWLMHGKLLVLLDGLNELPQRKLESKYVSPQEEADRAASADNRIPDARENSLLVLARQSQSYFLLSCRILDYTHMPGWQEFRILPLSNEQIDNFIQRHLGPKSQYLETILEQPSHLRELVQNPFYLRSLVILVQVNYQRMPTDRFQLVKYTCDAALARETLRRGVDVSAVLTPVAEDAFGAMVDGFIGSWFRTLIKVDSEHVDAFECAVGSGLLIRVGGDDEYVFYRYLHQLVQEALALAHLESGPFADDDYPEAQSLARIGEIHLEWGKIKEAEENLQWALKLCPSVGAESLRASILLHLSRVYRVWRKTREGIQYAEAAVQLADGLGDTVQLAETYHELGLANQRLRRTKDAEGYYRLALEVYDRLGERSLYAYEVLYGLAALYASPSVYRIKQAIDWYEKAMTIFEAEEDRIGIVHSNLKIAHALRLDGEIRQAIRLFQDCAVEFEELEKPLLQIEALYELGVALKDISIFEQALKLAREYNSFRQFDILIYGLSSAFSSKKRYVHAQDFLNEALKFANRQANPWFKMKAYLEIGRGYFLAKDFQKAAKYCLLCEKVMDDEYRLHLVPIDRLLLFWARRVGVHTHESWFARLLSRWGYSVDKLFARLRRPNYLFGRQLWRFWYWASRF